MKITNELIESFNPCRDGIDDFNERYPVYNDTLANLLRLDNISYDNKIWLACKVVDIKVLQQWAVECAEQVVDHYNDVYPNDSRINYCIEMTKLYLENKCSLDELSAADSAAMSAAWSAADSARSAADSAWSAAKSAAKSASWSAWSAAWSAADSASWSAAWSARSAASDQETINLSILIALLED